MFQRLCLILFTWATLGLPAQASVGIVVRLVTAGQDIQTPLSVTLTNAKGGDFTIAVKDDGTPPDVIPDDGGFSGAMIIDGQDFTVALLSGSNEPMELGSVSWSDGTTARDLVITMGDGIVTLETGSGLDVAATSGAPTESGSASTGVQPAGSNVGSPPTGSPGSPSPISPVTGAPAGMPSGALTPQGDTPSSDATLYIIGGFLLLTLAIIAFVWFRPPEDEPYAAASDRFEVVPEPGLLGDGTPSVTDGLSTWITPVEHASAFFQLLLQSLAQYHRVLIVADDELEVPIVHGGPLYRAKRTRPSHVADAVHDLMGGGGHPLAVLIQLPQIAADELQELVDLVPPGLGIVVLTDAVLGEHEPSVLITRVSEGWSLRCGADTIALRETDWGIQVDSPAPSA